MPEKLTFKITEVAELTGADRQWLQRWSGDGILRPEPEDEDDTAGRRAHRRFSIPEILICAPLVQLGRFGVSISQIKRVADEIRDQVIDSSGAAWSGEVPWRTAFENVSGGGQAWLIIASPHVGDAEPRIVVLNAGKLDFSEDWPGIGPLRAYPMLTVINLAQVWGRVFKMFEASGLPSR